MTIPAYIRPVRDAAGNVTNKGSLPLWSGKGEPPAIGAVVTCDDRKGTRVKVTGYEIEAGWLMVVGTRLIDGARGNLAGAEILWPEVEPSGFCRFLDHNGNERIGAYWTDEDKAEKYDKPLGSKRAGRPNEGTFRLGYTTLGYVFSGQFPAGYQRLELRPLAGLEFEGEPVVEMGGCPMGDNPAGSYIAIRPLSDAQRGRFHCGGVVLADIFLASYGHDGLPHVSCAHISRAHDGRLCIAIPA